MHFIKAFLGVKVFNKKLFYRFNFKGGKEQWQKQNLKEINPT